MNPIQSIDDIYAGAHDDILDDLTEAVNTRRNGLAAAAVKSLKAGDEIVISGNISPRYLAGAAASVAGVAVRKKIPVKLHHPVGRFPAGVEVRVPTACVTPVGSAVSA